MYFAMVPKSTLSRFLLHWLWAPWIHGWPYVVLCSQCLANLWPVVSHLPALLLGMTEDSNSAAVSSLATEVACKVRSKSDVQRKNQYKTLIEFAHGAHSVGTQKRCPISLLYFCLSWVITLKWGAGLSSRQAELWEEGWGVGREESKGKREKVAEKGEGMKDMTKPSAQSPGPSSSGRTATALFSIPTVNIPLLPYCSPFLSFPELYGHLFMGYWFIFQSGGYRPKMSI